jgi:hypothetical protein
MTPLQKIKRALRDLGFENAEIRLSQMSDGRVRGYLLSQRYAGIDHLDRQLELEDHLDEKVDKRTRGRIAYIWAIAPGEIDARPSRNGSVKTLRSGSPRARRAVSRRSPPRKRTASSARPSRR